ncbi:hypothetical protein DL93DRAFT_2088155 [Clavulina sp. PMI_390]|nr:hypothetical protein DL93DRAFT_2088155 [Clavulina sp. PMI_390]
MATDYGESDKLEKARGQVSVYNGKRGGVLVTRQTWKDVDEETFAVRRPASASDAFS